MSVYADTREIEHFVEEIIWITILYFPEEYGPADYMILYDKEGYYGFFDRIFRSALVRQKMRAGKEQVSVK